MGEPRFTFRYIIGLLRKQWWVVVACAVIAAGGTFISSSFQTPKFESTSTLFFALNQGTSAIDLNQGSVYTQSQMLSFAQLATSSRVLDPVIEKLDLDTTARELARSITVSIPQSTVTLSITASSLKPKSAAELANAVAGELVTAVKDVAPKDPDNESTITADVIDQAVPPEFQSSPNKSKDALYGGLLGGIIGFAIVLLVGVLDTRVRSEEVLAQVEDSPVLGVVSRSPLLASRTIGVATEPLGATSEDFRRIRSALTYANVASRVRVLLVTSGLAGEGKSTVSANLAITLAGLQHSVLLIDGDLRRPRAHEYAGIDGSIGLTDVLLDDVDFETAKYTVSGTTLDILPAGPIPPNPAELLTSSRMSELISTAAEAYDFVVIDSPPTLIVADAALLAPLVDGMILVVDATRTRRAAVLKSIRSLQAGGGRILGTVLNRARPVSRKNSYYSD